MTELTDLVDVQKISFYGSQGRIDLSPARRMKEKKLFRQLLEAQRTSGIMSKDGYLVVQGRGLSAYLGKPGSLQDFTSLLAEIYSLTLGRFYVNVNIERTNKKYLSEQKIPVSPEYFSLSDIFPKMTPFEQRWNTALSEARKVYTRGYPFPEDSHSWKLEIAAHASHFLIGTPAQLERYKAYTKICKVYRKDILRGIDFFGTGFKIPHRP